MAAHDEARPRQHQVYARPNAAAIQPLSEVRSLGLETGSLPAFDWRRSTVKDRLDQSEVSQFEETGFDALAKAIASGVSRRDALRRIAGSLAGAVLASLGLGKKAWSGPTANSQCQSFCKNTCHI